MTKHCIECHTLEFEPAVTSRQVPHGSVDGVMQAMQEFYANLALNRVAVDTIDTGDIKRSIPRRAGGTISEEERQRALKWARAKGEKVAQDLFEARVCIVCHEIVKAMGPRGEQDGIAYGVAPVHVAATWLPAARFDHDKHRTYTCEECHDKVAESKSSADVAVPTIESCRKCHAGNAPAASKVASTCIDCHGFHLPGHAGWISVRRCRRRPGASVSAFRSIATLVALSAPWCSPAAGVARQRSAGGCSGDCEATGPTALTVADVQRRSPRRLPGGRTGRRRPSPSSTASATCSGCSG
jgi:hypothetical protein